MTAAMVSPVAVSRWRYCISSAEVVESCLRREGRREGMHGYCFRGEREGEGDEGRKDENKETFFS